MGRKGASIRRSKLAAGLYALPTSTGRTALSPDWQFDGNQVVPGLRTIISNFPQYAHPLTIQQFMTEGNEELDGRSPGEWLSAGGAVGAAASLLAELGYD